jgi:hypothetical protein
MIQNPAIGQASGMFTIIGNAPSQSGHRYWVVRCHCGAEHVARGAHLKVGRMPKCDHAQGKMTLIDREISKQAQNLPPEGLGKFVQGQSNEIQDLRDTVELFDGRISAAVRLASHTADSLKDVQRLDIADIRDQLRELKAYVMRMPEPPEAPPTPEVDEHGRTWVDTDRNAETDPKTHQRNPFHFDNLFRDFPKETWPERRKANLEEAHRLLALPYNFRTLEQMEECLSRFTVEYRLLVKQSLQTTHDPVLSQQLSDLNLLMRRQVNPFAWNRKPEE